MNRREEKDSAREREEASEEVEPFWKMVRLSAESGSSAPVIDSVPLRDQERRSPRQLRVGGGLASLTWLSFSLPFYFIYFSLPLSYCVSFFPAFLYFSVSYFFPYPFLLFFVHTNIRCCGMSLYCSYVLFFFFFFLRSCSLLPYNSLASFFHFLPKMSFFLNIISSFLWFLFFNLMEEERYSYTQ